MGLYIVGSVDTFELPNGVVLRSFTYRGSALDHAPRFITEGPGHGPPSGVTGDVIIRDNPALPEAEITALLAALGPVSGTTLVCGNLGQEACVEP